MMTMDAIKLAAEKGDVSSQYQLATIYIKGASDVPKSFPEGIRWLKKAANQGLAQAQYFLGWLYCEGEPEFRNTDEGELLLGYAAESGHRDAQQYLGTRLYKAHNYAKAIELYHLAAKQGDELALYQLGHIYSEGKLVAKDLVKAFDCLHKSAEIGNREAQLSVGLMLGMGKGIERDYKESVYWLNKSAEQGLAEAEYRLGLMLLNGENDVKINTNAGLAFLSKAAKQGHIDALKVVGHVDSIATSLPWIQISIAIVAIIAVFGFFF